MRHHHQPTKKPLPVRLSRADFRRRINGPVGIEFGSEELTTHAGLELVQRFVARFGFASDYASWVRLLACSLPTLASFELFLASTTAGGFPVSKRA